MKTKERLKGYMEEEGKLLDSEAEGGKFISDPKKSIKIAATRGRPKSKPASKAIIFHLPLELIAQIDAEAERVTTSNKSAFAVKVFTEYFASRV